MKRATFITPLLFINLALAACGGSRDLSKEVSTDIAKSENNAQQKMRRCVEFLEGSDIYVVENLSHTGHRGAEFWRDSFDLKRILLSTKSALNNNLFVPFRTNYAAHNIDTPISGVSVIKCELLDARLENGEAPEDSSYINKLVTRNNCGDMSAPPGHRSIVEHQEKIEGNQLIAYSKYYECGPLGAAGIKGAATNSGKSTAQIFKLNKDQKQQLIQVLKTRGCVETDSSGYSCKEKLFP